MRYLVSYDLLNPGKDYRPLWTALGDLGGVRVLESQWVMDRTNTTPKGLADYILKFMDANDRILVTEMPSNYAYRNLIAVPNAA
jgi:hypothetical protein